MGRRVEARGFEVRPRPSTSAKKARAAEMHATAELPQNAQKYAHGRCQLHYFRTLTERSTTATVAYGCKLYPALAEGYISEEFLSKIVWINMTMDVMRF